MRQLDELQLETTIVMVLSGTTKIQVGEDVTTTSVSEPGVPPTLENLGKENVLIFYQHIFLIKNIMYKLNYYESTQQQKIFIFI